MCTLLVWKNRRPGWPIVIAANRDEFQGRPSSGPQRLVERPLIVGGRDEAAGGTWLAISEHGIVVALTNRRRAGKHDPAKRSRGQLVLEFARAPSLAQMRAQAESIEADAYNPFVLVALDAAEGFFLQMGSDGAIFGAIADGVHTVTNWEFDSRDHPKAERAFALAASFEVARGSEDELAARLHRLLSDHAPGLGALDGGLCVHRPDEAYGTRSSAIVMLRADALAGHRPAPAVRYYSVEGHPCRNPLTDMTNLLGREDATRAGVES